MPFAMAPLGPEMAAAFHAVASCATVVPLNPALKTDEYRTYMQMAGVQQDAELRIVDLAHHPQAVVERKNLV